MNEIILAVGAHPDDIELGCGGTLKLHINSGDKVYGLVLTKGENGKHCTDSRECIDSAKFLGLEELKILEFKDGMLTADYRLVSAIEKFIGHHNPTIVYSHSEHDRHQDHRNASLATKSAARAVDKIILYESPSSTVDFAPHYFNDITPTFKDKIKALSHYESQLKRGSILSLDRVEAQAKYWSQRNGGKKNIIEYVEAFETNHFFNRFNNH